jgi:site-specific DNA-methyltransferase (adenine-specific)
LPSLSLIAAQPGNLGKKGADRGIDGNIYFGKTHRAIVSVKRVTMWVSP